MIYSGYQNVKRWLLMKVTWLAQAGILLERGGVRIMIDPYF